MSLALVKIMSDDLQQIMDWRMKPEVTKFMYTDPVLTLEGQQKWFDYIQKDQTTMHWLIMIDDVKIGLINLYDIDYKNKRCSWAYYIGDTSFRGRGIATTLECNIYDYVFDVCLASRKYRVRQLKNTEVGRLPSHGSGRG
jgi:RimJ/RimL family protein N-acetyltransferase